MSLREFPKVFYVRLMSPWLRPLERLEMHPETIRVVVFGLTRFRNLLYVFMSCSLLV